MLAASVEPAAFVAVDAGTGFPAGVEDPLAEAIEVGGFIVGPANFGSGLVAAIAGVIGGNLSSVDFPPAQK